MRTRLSYPIAFLYLLSALFLLTVTARADDDTTNNDDEYDEQARVLRVSLVKGEVTLSRDGGDEWETAQLNAPLVEGDTLATGRDSRLEIQADSRNFIRVGENSVLKVVTLRDEGIALSLSEGTATVVLSRFDRSKEYFEVDAPKTTVAAEQAGQYRIDVDSSGGVRVTVREDGRARVYSETSGFELRSDRTARFTLNDEGDGDWDLSAAAAQLDEWDNWNEERGRYLASRLQDEGRDRYYDSDIYGAEDLDSYGDWSYTNDYGYVWRPSATYVSSYDDWAPYRYGHWDWCQPYGWTWIADEPWGWAPYHYGRWVNINNSWAWAPRGYGYPHGRTRWRPALVAFTTLDFGGERRVCWYPLGYGQRDPRGRFWARSFDPRRPHDIDRRPLPWNPALLRAVSSVPLDHFGERHVHAHPVEGDLARRTLASEPVRGRLPVEPANGWRNDGRQRQVGTNGGNQTLGANGRPVLTINRPAPLLPPRGIPERQTGATARTPGVPLDEELRRSRFFGERSRRAPQPANTSGEPRNNVDNTGAVARPFPARRPLPDAVTGEPDSDGDRHSRRNDHDGHDDTTSTPHYRPTRPPAQPNPVRVDDGGTRREERSKPAPTYRPQPSTPTPGEGERERTSPREVPPTYHRERPAPPTYNQPPPRQEPPHYEPPHYEPPRREPPRQETPRQEAPRPQTPRQESPHKERPASSPSSHEDHPRGRP
ncbi:MAG TPA: DUF6600 domain-containing protein [Pyrinomonadaceae bacterium]|nr:DUF6600 domain-containing protein [Pyrinomonadaceae bacterium]